MARRRTVRRCAICGSTENLQRHHVGTGGRTVWVCERCHNREHRRFKVVSPNRSAFRRESLAGLDLEALREELSIYGRYVREAIRQRAY